MISRHRFQPLWKQKDMTSFTFSVTCWASKHEAKPAKPRLAQHKLQFWFFVFQLIFVVLAPWHVLAPISVLRFRHTVQLPGKSSLWSTCCSIISKVAAEISIFYLCFLILCRNDGECILSNSISIWALAMHSFARSRPWGSQSSHSSNTSPKIPKKLSKSWPPLGCVVSAVLWPAPLELQDLRGRMRPLKGTSTDQPCAPS